MVVWGIYATADVNELRMVRLFMAIWRVYVATDANDDDNVDNDDNVEHEDDAGVMYEQANGRPNMDDAPLDEHYDVIEMDEGGVDRAEEPANHAGEHAAQPRVYRVRLARERDWIDVANVIGHRLRNNRPVQQ